MLRKIRESGKVTWFTEFAHCKTVQHFSPAFSCYQRKRGKEGLSDCFMAYF